MLNGGLQPPSSGYVANDKDAIKRLKDFQKEDKKKPNPISRKILDYIKDQFSNDIIDK